MHTNATQTSRIIFELIGDWPPKRDEYYIRSHGTEGASDDYVYAVVDLDLETEKYPILRLLAGGPPCRL